MKTKLTSYVMTAVVVFLFAGMHCSQAQITPANMVWIPSGTFTMGDALNDGNYYEQPLHTVSVSAFFMDKYKVTKTLWDQVYQWAILHGYTFNNVGLGKASNHPVHTISWYDMVKWCNARSEKEGLTPAYYTSASQTTVYRSGQINVTNNWVKWNAGYRLPTEAEWERAARGGNSGHRFPWSNVETITHSQANYYSYASYFYDVSPTRDYHPTFKVGGQPYTNPVDYFAPNDFGLYDMVGNVFDWCWDLYNPTYYSTSPGSDPHGPTSPTYGLFRVLRGGSWGNQANFCRVASRPCDAPNITSVIYGFRTVLPSAIPYCWICTIVPSTQPTYTCPIVRQPGKTNLVVVTHGWIPKENGQTVPPDPTWIDDMARAISNNLVSRGLNDWQVETFRWKEKAWKTWEQLVLGDVIKNAEKEGGNLGKCISNQWSQIHLIGHSAGAGVIQTASENIKLNSVNTTIHLTFLDPFTGSLDGRRKQYGKGVNWADSYFAFDLGTGDDVVSRTAGKLDHAYNIEITWLDPNKKQTGSYRSTASSTGVEQCFETVSSHGWPYQFYMNTIPPFAITNSAGFGFPLSKEGGNWDLATNSYAPGNDSLVLGTPDVPCYVQMLNSPGFMSPVFDFTGSSRQQSYTGIIQSGLGFLKLITGSPVWLAVSVSYTNAVNFVSFDAEFQSGAGAEGLLSVYWDTNLIGSVDEHIVPQGLRSYSFSFPGTETNSFHVLGLRLDPFGGAQSTALVTNVTFGFAGVSQPFTLSITSNTITGARVFELRGEPGFTYIAEASTNMTDWTAIALLSNTNGVVRFTDPSSTNMSRRFYRAVVGQ